MGKELLYIQMIRMRGEYGNKVRELIYKESKCLKRNLSNFDL